MAAKHFYLLLWEKWDFLAFQETGHSHLAYLDKIHILDKKWKAIYRFNRVGVPFTHNIWKTSNVPNNLFVVCQLNSIDYFTSLVRIMIVSLDMH